MNAGPEDRTDAEIFEEAERRRRQRVLDDTAMHPIRNRMMKRRRRPGDPVETEPVAPRPNRPKSGGAEAKPEAKSEITTAALTAFSL